MNKFILFKYNAKALPPIDDYNSDGILSLDTALKPVLCSVDQLDHYIKKAKELRHYPSEHSLTEDESAAVYLYTDDYDGQNLNRALNQALQSEDRTNLTPWLGFLKLFNNALKKLPTVKDTIWRGLSNNIAKQLKENDEVVCWGVTSCSISTDIIRNILDQNSVLCSIKPLNGKYIHGYTPFSNDHEVLLFPGTRLRVKIQESSNEIDKPVICLEEIKDISEDQTPSNDVTMKSLHESDNEEDTEDKDHLTIRPTTSVNIMNNKSCPENEESKENKIKAVITFSNGDKYEVTYQNDRKLGHGKYYRVNGEELEGRDADDQANGEGICVFPSGYYFIGTFKNGNRHGHGILLDNDVNGSIKAGFWTNDELDNQSLKTIPNSDKYEWEDDRNEKRWYGAYDDNNGNKYIGNVVDDKRAEGLGIRIWCENSRYEGNFKNDKKHGYGIYHHPDRAKYEGQWANDKMNGDGKYQWASGTKYTGQFINGKRHGQGTLEFTDGKIQQGNWENDEYVGENTLLSTSNQ